MEKQKAKKKKYVFMILNQDTKKKKEDYWLNRFCGLFIHEALYYS